MKPSQPPTIPQQSKGMHGTPQKVTTIQLEQITLLKASTSLQVTHCATQQSSEGWTTWQHSITRDASAAWLETSPDPFLPHTQSLHLSAPATHTASRPPDPPAHAAAAPASPPPVAQLLYVSCSRASSDAVACCKPCCHCFPLRA